ncbi:MAG: AI-2E family transporter [Flavobacteriales bacterium]|nr:AI-2E family transporter [Flavobacteriales bacterium]
MNDLGTTNRLLLIIVIPLIFYLLKELSFIFVPLFFSMFIALLFLPLMRWLKKKNVPNALSVVAVLGIIASMLYLSGRLIRLSTSELLSVNSSFVALAEIKLLGLVVSIESFIGIERIAGVQVIDHYLKEFNVFDNLGPSVGMVGDTLTMILMTTFFVVLLLAGSINLQDVMQVVIFRKKYASVKVFRRVEKDIIKFIRVKFIISFFTGVGFTLACLFFDVNFPIFWGLFAFLINFVQMVGSIVSVILLSLFAMVEIDPSGTLLAFVLVIIGVQVLMGSILEPIFLGKTFSINVITVLVMLMLWGYIWGVPGLIMAIPITVFIKIILEQFPGTKVIARLMSGATVVAVDPR